MSPRDLKRKRQVEPEASTSRNSPKKIRENFPEETTALLTEWFMAHLEHPYPTEEEKEQLAIKGHIEKKQVSQWFVNARRRIPEYTENQSNDRVNHPQKRKNPAPLEGSAEKEEAAIKEKVDIALIMAMFSERAIVFPTTDLTTSPQH